MLFSILGVLAGLAIVVSAVLLRHPSVAPQPHTNAVTITAMSSAAISTAMQDMRSADMPDSTLTPGAVATTDTTIVCAPGYATSVRPTGSIWRRLKEEAYGEYSLPRGHRSTVDAYGIRHPAYEVDHLIPLELGGSPTDIHNLWPEPIDSARQKDKVENELHSLVCNGQVPLTQAQEAIARNWKTAIP
jgi:hypothetical protein